MIQDIIIPTLEPGFTMWASLAIMMGAIVLYALDKFPMEMVSIGVLVTLLVLFYLVPVNDPSGVNLLGPRTLLAGFAEPALITVMALLVVGQGMVVTGALNNAARQLMRIGRGRMKLMAITIIAAVMIISAILNNTPVVVIFIPIFSVMADRLGIPLSKVMMPLSFVAILGGMTTLIGSSTNLLVAGQVHQMITDEISGKAGLGAQLEEIGFFDFIVPGALLAGTGLIYTLFIGHRLLTDRSSLASELTGDGKHYIAEINISADSPLRGATPIAGQFPALRNMTVRLIQRGQKAILPPFEDAVLEPGDAVIVAATRKALTDLLTEKPELMEATLGEIAEVASVGDKENATKSRVLAEAVIAPASRAIGRNLVQLGFVYRTGCIVLGIQRRSRMIRSGMNSIRLEAGDVLLVIGQPDDVNSLRDSQDVILLEWSATELPRLEHAIRATAIFAAVVTLAAANIVPIVIAALGGAAAMIASGCLNVRQAARAIDRRVYLLVAAALALGSTLKVTGGATYIAVAMVDSLIWTTPAMVLSAYFLLVALLTNILSNNATAVLFTPVAVQTGIQLGVDPMIFVYATIFAANCSFATPISYQTNLLVMGPGHYRFIDYLKAGGPLIVVLWLTFSLFAPWYYGL